MKWLVKSLFIVLCSFVMVLPGAFAAEPLSGKTVYVDAGHGGEDSGAVGNGLLEKDVNLDVSKLLNEKLQDEGADTVMTRTDDTFLTLDDRVAKADADGSDLFISIHANSAVPEASGTETYFDSTYQAAESERLASEIQERLPGALETADRGVKESPFYVIKHSKMPSALVELGFITNESDADKLISSQYQKKAADSIAEAVVSYYE
ncbi:MULTISPECIES: N-acetylmuramoyl-L-alanine amidase family protein [Bacillus]|uniref:N-acetylmuramoyl-L-alanine amidase family protein n=1 Tax=Bacillus TaxID=1386 RepID=UPI000556AEDD|nr:MULTISPECIES: N-acetylmuramoyl-L-alanine amidase [Bacillus]QHZ47598.1 N-acetylmuramoyl-L-alanine amidase [Bacillus sp. NSP9.1]WFA03653.1 N-acetylmuramoyl-L-alanine amidase [Bacillus sp. HSf4]